MQKKFKPKKTSTREGRARYIFIATTLALLIAVGIITLVVCWNYFKWEWQYIADFLNPFNNGLILFVYVGIVLAIYVLAWAIHESRMKR